MPPAGSMFLEQQHQQKTIASYPSQKSQCRVSQEDTSESALPSVCLTVCAQMMGVLWWVIWLFFKGGLHAEGKRGCSRGADNLGGWDSSTTQDLKCIDSVKYRQDCETQLPLFAQARFMLESLPDFLCRLFLFPSNVGKGWACSLVKGLSVPTLFTSLVCKSFSSQADRSL